MINWASLPALTSLRAFSALAETGSVVRAGAALNVSHAAISQQIKALETFMSLRLVDRSKRGLTLTDQGAQLARALAKGFGTIATEIEAMTNADADRPLQITTTQLFAMTWLMPRIAGFQEKNPNINLLINPTRELADPTVGGLDLALRFGSGDWPGFEAELLVPTDIAAAAAPSLLNGKEINEPKDLLDFPWLQELGSQEPMDWFYTHGINVQKLRTLEVPGNLMLDAAKRGQGVILAAYSNIEKDVQENALTVLFRDGSDTGYYILSQPQTIRPQARKFIHWLMAEAQK